MELRKLQKTGGTTYVVSLPKNWIKKEHLDRGSLVTIKEQKDGNLLLIPRASMEKEQKICEIEAKENLHRKLVEKYLLGYDIVKIISEKNLNKYKVDIKNSMRSLIGFEIIEETANTLTIQNLLNPAEISILKSLRRMYTIVSVMHKDLSEAIESNNSKLLRDVIQRDLEVNRLYFLVVRQIRTAIQNPMLLDKEGIKAVDCVDYRFVAKIIEQIGDQLEELATSMLKPKTLNEFKALNETIKSTYEVHNKAATALFKKDENLAIESQKLAESIDFSIELKEKSEARKLLPKLKRITELGKDLADNVASE